LPTNSKMTPIRQHLFLEIFGLPAQELPHLSCFFELGEKVFTGCSPLKGFIFDQANGEQLIFADYEGQLFWGVRMAWHNYLPLQFLPVKNNDHLYSLFILYGKSEVLCN